MARTVEADYLVVGAGAMGMAFTDALIDHADVRVALVDRRHGVGGHWLAAYPFVRLHQASAFYGVPSTLLGGGRLQQHGPEAGLQERATAPEISTYYDECWPSGCSSRAGWSSSRTATTSATAPSSRASPGGSTTCRSGAGSSMRATSLRTSRARRRRRSTSPTACGWSRSTTWPTVTEAPSQYVVVGSGKTATDACLWLLGRGVEPDAICWVRPRDPWMLNRAVVQPDPAVYLGMVADMLAAGEAAASLDDLFLRLEGLGIMLRIDRSVTPTMAKAPTLAMWELELLRTLEHVVRLGHIRSVRPGRITLDEGAVDIARDAVVVHCAASGLKYPPNVPIWGSSITLQTVRAGFPCFGAAVTGYVEATRQDDAEKNRLCPPSPYPDSLAGWATMNVVGMRSAMSFGARAGHQGVGRHGRPQPGPGPARAPRLARAGRRSRPAAGAHRPGPGPAGRAQRGRALRLSRPTTVRAGEPRSRWRAAASRGRPRAGRR